VRGGGGQHLTAGDAADDTWEVADNSWGCGRWQLGRRRMGVKVGGGGVRRGGGKDQRAVE
jgi:hypothetical protein